MITARWNKLPKSSFGTGFKWGKLTSYVFVVVVVVAVVVIIIVVLVAIVVFVVIGGGVIVIVDNDVTVLLILLCFVNSLLCFFLYYFPILIYIRFWYNSREIPQLCRPKTSTPLPMQMHCEKQWKDLALTMMRSSTLFADAQMSSDKYVLNTWIYILRMYFN